MLVVADASPFIGLLKIGHVDVLPQLFGSVVIPTEVANAIAFLVSDQARFITGQVLRVDGGSQIFPM